MPPHSRNGRDHVNGPDGEDWCCWVSCGRSYGICFHDGAFRDQPPSAEDGVGAVRGLVKRAASRGPKRQLQRLKCGAICDGKLAVVASALTQGNRSTWQPVPARCELCGRIISARRNSELARAVLSLRFGIPPTLSIAICR